MAALWQAMPAKCCGRCEHAAFAVASVRQRAAPNAARNVPGAFAGAPDLNWPEGLWTLGISLPQMYAYLIGDQSEYDIKEQGVWTGALLFV